MTIGELSKGQVVTARPEETIQEAAKRMRDRHVGALVVTDSVDRPVGILTDRDIVISVVAQSPANVTGLLVGDVMSDEVVVAHVHDSLDQAMRNMLVHGIRRLPIVSADGRIAGIITLDDLLRVMSKEFMELVGLVAQEQIRERAVRK